jgi:hypothetical protein
LKGTGFSPSVDGFVGLPASAAEGTQIGKKTSLGG